VATTVCCQAGRFKKPVKWSLTTQVIAHPALSAALAVHRQLR
jgi:hypothetical protein